MGQCWWEIQVRCDRALEDTVFWRLRKFGCRGTAGEIKGQTCLMRGYLPEQQATPLDLAALSQFLQQDALCAEFPTPATSWRIMEEEDWAKSWQDYWHPQEIGDRLLIYPAWLKPPSDPERLILRLDPGAAFGTGGHATTQLCLESLEMRLGSMDLDPDAPALDNFTLADVGCGSGILSIAALLMGIKRAYAVDVDTLAISSTLRNATLNRLQAPRLVTQQGSVEQLIQLTSGPVDGIVCNILAEVIIKLIPQLGEIAKPTTWGILSGILLEQAKAVTDVLEDHGWVVATLWRRQNWCCLNIRRS